MAEIVSEDELLDARGSYREGDAYVVAAAFDRGGAWAGFARGDGSLRLLPRADLTDWRDVPAHAGGILALAPDAAPGGFLTGGDDGAFRRVGADGTVRELGRYGGKWVEQVASHADPKAGPGGGLVACAVGKVAHLFDGAGGLLKSLPHPSTVSGLAFDGRGKRLCVSHYNGASLWFAASKSDNPRRLEWKGSHIGIAVHPAGDAVVTAMQENALHGWRLADGQHMRMSGYPAKTESLSFSRTGKWLASSGADAVVLWPFFAGGPMGKPPVELAGGGDALCTRVACHPSADMVAAGFADGAVRLVDVNSERILPVCGPGRGRVSALAWNPDGSHLAWGTETGFTAVVDLSSR